MIYILVPGLVIWMLGCAYCGYERRFGLFLFVLAIGVALNTLWMVFGLDAKPLSPPAIMAHAGFVLYAITALGLGFLAGRLAQVFRETRVRADD